MDKETLQFTLKACRVNANMTLQSLAKRLNKDEKTIRNWENGKTVPSSTEIRELSKILCVPEKLIFLGRSSSLTRHYENIMKENIVFPLIECVNR